MEAAARRTNNDSFHQVFISELPSSSSSRSSRISPPPTVGEESERREVKRDTWRKKNIRRGWKNCEVLLRSPLFLSGREQKQEGETSMSKSSESN